MITFKDFLLLEYEGTTNIINAKGEPIVITDKNGNAIDELSSFDRIMTNFLEREVYKNPRLQNTTPEVGTIKDWYRRNFAAWFKKGGSGATDVHTNMPAERFRERFYEPLEDYIETTLDQHDELVQQKKLSYEHILSQFPSYARGPNGKAADGAVLFSGGRMFRLKGLVPVVENLSDYLLALAVVALEPNQTLVPSQFNVVFNRLDKLSVPDALTKSHEWHRYLEANKNKVQREELLAKLKQLQAGQDYTVIMKWPDAFMVRVLSRACTDVEGKAMAHCVASYGSEVERGSTIIFSLRSRDGLPVCTIESSPDGNLRQIKGPHNGPVHNEWWPHIQEWIIRNDMKISSRDPRDAKYIGIDNVQDFYQKGKEHFKKPENQKGQIIEPALASIKTKKAK